jgi:hypothetical protein
MEPRNPNRWAADSSFDHRISGISRISCIMRIMRISRIMRIVS